MKKICCIFVASLLVISMTIPMVFAGAQPQQTDQVTEETSSVEPVRAIADSFTLDPGYAEFAHVVYNYEYTRRLNTTYLYEVLSECPQSFMVYFSGTPWKWFQVNNDIDNSTKTVSIIGDGTYQVICDGVTTSCNANTLYSFNFDNFVSFVQNDVSVTKWVVVFALDPQQSYLLSPVYNLFVSSGVNEEWSSIGVVIFALLPIITIWLIIGRAFKGKKS